jgi:hypothetical protein
MANFKITNITGSLGKRHPNNNMPLEIEYITGFEKITHVIRPNEEFFLTTPSLPVGVHKLRMKNFVTVVEIGEKELLMQKKAKQTLPKPEIKQSAVVEPAPVQEVVAKNDGGEKKSKKQTHTTTTQSPE